MKTIIHRDLSFEFRGQRYRLLAGGPGWGYEIVTDERDHVADGFHTLADVRAYVDRARREGWVSLRASDGLD